uniref:Uncharacterized protein n=1 Tax=Rhizophora mucronata TaxID=61149 RepID=A0A2P2NER6_RHIMU
MTMFMRIGDLLGLVTHYKMR